MKTACYVMRNIYRLQARGMAGLVGGRRRRAAAKTVKTVECYVRRCRSAAVISVQHEMARRREV